MQLSHSGRLAFTKQNILMSLLNNLEQNLVGDKGCEALSKAKWPQIYNLRLELVDFKNNNLNKQEFTDALYKDFKETLCVSF